MNHYSKSKFAFDAFRNLSSKILPKDFIQGSRSRISHSGHSFTPGQTSNSPGFQSASIVQRFGRRVGENRRRHDPFFGDSKRFYYVDRYRVQHFKPRGAPRWFQDPRAVVIFVCVGSGVFITVYYGNLETIPYSKRKHFVLLSRDLERSLGESEFERMKAAFKGKILPAVHPESVRVRLIAKDIIEALQRGLRQENSWSDLGYASEAAIGAPKESGHQTLMELRDSGAAKVEGKWYPEDEILDDKWVERSRKKGQEQGSQANTSHLDGFKWEVLVVDKPVVNAICLPGGKIVVFTGLLEQFKSDAEIATIIGHEVAHAVARHSAEIVAKNLWFFVLRVILFLFVTPDIVNTMSTLLLRLPFSRRMEMEADYIGLLLMASAGYDPRVAPLLYEKMGKFTGTSTLDDYLSTHPSGKKRAQLLAHAKVMEEALNIYREVIAGRGVEGFL